MVCDSYLDVDGRRHACEVFTDHTMHEATIAVHVEMRGRCLGDVIGEDTGCRLVDYGDELRVRWPRA